MNTILKTTAIGLLLAATVAPIAATGNDIITCESRHQRYVTCPIQTHGYVVLRRQISRAACIQGVTWDYDKRNIWVDGNCKGEFEVENRKHSKKSNTKNAVAAAAAIAIIAAMASNNKKDKHDKYNDEDYKGSRHTSFIPGWMIGDFEGYNMDHDADVFMSIDEDGRVEARVNGTKLHGYVNDERLYIGDSEFYLDRAGKGFNTTQVGNTSNQVHYVRR